MLVWWVEYVWEAKRQLSMDNTWTTKTGNLPESWNPKTKVKLSQYRSWRHTARAGGIASLILTLATTLRSIVNFTPLPFYPRERTPVPTQYVARWASQPVWTIFGEDTVSCPCRVSNPVQSSPAFLKLWFADHKWSSGSVLVVLLDWTLVQKRQKK